MSEVNLVFMLIFVLFLIAHTVVLAITERRYKNDEKNIKNYWLSFTQKIEGTITPDQQCSLAEFVRHISDDIHHVLSKPPNDPQRESFLKRYRVKREDRPEIDNLTFNTLENLVRRMVEVYPVLGILGTITSLWVSSRAADTTAILENFLTAMWTTFAGLVLWIAFTLWTAGRERAWERLPEGASKSRDLIWDIERKAGGDRH